MPGRGNYALQPLFVKDFAELAVEVATGRGNPRAGRRRPRGIQIRTPAESNQGQHRSQVPDTAGPQVARLRRQQGTEPVDQGHRHHQGRNRRTLKRSPDIQVLTTHAGQHLALRLAEAQRHRARPHIRQRGQAALPITSNRRARLSPYTGITPDDSPPALPFATDSKRYRGRLS